MTPDEIKACYRLYAAHRMSHEIWAFPETIPVMNNDGDSDDLVIVLGLHIGLEGMAREIRQGDPNDGLRPVAPGRAEHLGKMVASFAAHLFGRGALVAR
jgi:hypothetical protein